MFNWLREWYEIRNPPCRSCENFRMEIARLRQDNEKLLDRILTPPKEIPKEPEVNSKAMLPLNPGVIPWRVKQQLLEAEDREKAKLLRQAPKPVSVDDLEKEMGIVETKREEMKSGN